MPSEFRHPRAVGNLISGAWALHPDKLAEFDVLFQNYVRDGKGLVEAFEAKATQRPAEPEPYQVREGVAVIPVEGTIARRMNMFMRFSGGTSTELLRKDIETAAADPDVEAILLEVDSPGGSVHGLAELNEAIGNVEKPIVVFAAELMASAAYWIGSAAARIVASPSAEIGSIGVAMLHVDKSKQLESAGVKATWLTAGKYKRIVTNVEPLSREGQDYLQGMLDHYYSLFVDAVADNRGVSTETVLEKMADGKIFIGEQALTAGLVDEIGDMETALALARQLATTTQGGSTMPTPKQSAPEGPDTNGLDYASLSVEQLEEHRPDLVEQLTARGKAEGVEEGTKVERKRVITIIEADGDQQVALDCINDGTSAADAGMKFFQAEKAKRSNALKEMAEEAPEAVGAVEPDESVPDAESKTPDRELAAKAAKLAAEEGISVTEAQDKVLAKDPDLKKRLKESLV